MIRLIGGRFGGRLLKSPQTSATRPTSSLLRKALFDILQNKVEGSRWLDLFAGSGAIAFEALSRGASEAVLVDKDPAALRCIRENGKVLGLEKQIQILGCDARSALKLLVKERKAFDFIYLDPPYSDWKMACEVLQFLDGASLLKPEGILFLEQGSAQKGLLPMFHNLKLFSSRNYGSSVLQQFCFPKKD